VSKRGVGLLYLSDRRVAYSSLAFHMLRGYLQEAGVPVHTYFLEGGEVRGEGVQPHPRKLPLMLVSLPYELMYLDLARALTYIGVPPTRQGRQGPVIVAGGPAVTANPAPVTEILDAALIGEAEPLLDSIADAADKGSRSAVLESLASEEGILVPGYKDKARKVHVKKLDEAWYPVRQHIPPNVEPVWGRSYMLETTRGCARMCRFCMEGMVFLPKRDRSYPRLQELLDEGVGVNKVGKVSFYSLAFFDSPHAEKILSYAVEKGLEVSVPSIRAETLTTERARLIAAGGQRTITIAPETGSCRLGKAINKCIGREGALTAVQNALEGGVRNVKLYIMVGFPGETEDDIEETIAMIREASKLVSRGGGRLRVSINPFMPKPMTALQWAPLEDVGSLRKKIARMYKQAAKSGAQASSYDPKWALAQTILARGGPELGSLILEWARRGGKLGALRAAARVTRIDLARYTGELPETLELPWHRLVDHPYVKPERLLAEYRVYKSLMGGGLRIKGGKG